jgi:cytochrome c oxidase assembly protein subunit 15
MILIPVSERQTRPKLHKLTLVIIIVLTLQLIYGGFMAGLHAALAASTWPDINGMAIPQNMFSSLAGVTNNPITVQFIHRGLAYVLVILIFIWWRKARGSRSGSLLHKWCWLPVSIVLLQVLLGILTVLNSEARIPVDMAVTHQFAGMLLLEAMFFMLFLVPGKTMRS